MGLQREGAADALWLPLQVGVDGLQALLPVPAVVFQLAAFLPDPAQIQQQLSEVLVGAAAGAEDAFALLLQHPHKPGHLVASFWAAS